MSRFLLIKLPTSGGEEFNIKSKEQKLEYDIKDGVLKMVVIQKVGRKVLPYFLVGAMALSNPFYRVHGQELIKNEKPERIPSKPDMIEYRLANVLGYIQKNGSEHGIAQITSVDFHQNRFFIVGKPDGKESCLFFPHFTLETDRLPPNDYEYDYSDKKNPFKKFNNVYFVQKEVGGRPVFAPNPDGNQLKMMESHLVQKELNLYGISNELTAQVQFNVSTNVSDAHRFMREMSIRVSLLPGIRTEGKIYSLTLKNGLDLHCGIVFYNPRDDVSRLDTLI